MDPEIPAALLGVAIGGATAGLAVGLDWSHKVSDLLQISDTVLPSS